MRGRQPARRRSGSGRYRRACGLRGHQFERQRIDPVLHLEHARRRASLRCRPVALQPRPATTIGPESISGTTKCTVAPCTLAPASSARLWVSRPLNAGSSAGWMLSMRPCHCATKPGVSSRMKPARQTKSMLCFPAPPAARARTRRGPCRMRCDRSPRWRCRPRARTLQARRRRPVRDHQRDLGRDSRSSFAASISAAMLEPRPEIRTATRLRLIASPEIEFAVIDDARLRRPRATTLADDRTPFRRPA